jgi:hypothetical protein
LQRSRAEFIPAFEIATVYAWLGELDRAFEWLDNACRERSTFLPWIRSWPLFRPLRNDPRYDLLLTRIGLRDHFSPR